MSNAKTHLLPLSGRGAACGKQFVEMTPEINAVTCDACVKVHDEALAAQEVADA